MNGKIDIRAFRLGKWYIPKTMESFEEKQEGYHALGYFDIIEIKEPEETGTIHPWLGAYQASERLEGELQSNYFVQEIKAFTNVSEDGRNGFKSEDIETFWHDESLLLCMSMLHVSLDLDINKLIDKVNALFVGKQYLYYYSFDYSGVIVVAKDINIHDYLDLMFQLNYDHKGHGKLVKDSYSFYGLQKKKFLSLFKGTELQKPLVNEAVADGGTYDVATNISIRNYSEYVLFKKALDEFEKENGYKSDKFQLPGRHDVSIVNKKANFYWILYMQYLLDSYSVEDKKSFYAYETFVKVLPQNESDLGNDEGEVESENKVYDGISENLRNAYDQFDDAIKEGKYLSYRIPVREVCNSILSILKNAFAEDFVLCMYQPFLGFLKYLNDKLDEQKNAKNSNVMYDKEIENCFNNFFDGLSSLVNSAMHTDRQFIHATSFSAIFYDVPPKIMAFYVAMIRRICEVMSKNDKHHYTFLMKPGFCDEISVKVISFECAHPEDRILQIAINEQFLYHPQAVMRRIAHEIAHFKGDGLRLRNVRKEKMMRTYIHVILKECLPTVFQNDTLFEDLENKVYSFFEAVAGFGCEEDNYGYQVKRLYAAMLHYIIESDEIQGFFKWFVQEEIVYQQEHSSMSDLEKMIAEIQKDKNLSVVDGLQNCSEIQMLYVEHELLEIINNNLRELHERKEVVIKGQDNHYSREVLCGKPMWDYVIGLGSMYSETYADIQMIQVLGISYEEYLRAFIEDEKLDIDLFADNIEDLSRIAAITKLMQEEGIWNTDIILPNSLKKIHEDIKDFLEYTSQTKDVLEKQNQYLIEYLKECMNVSREHYNMEEDKIRDIQNIVGRIVKHEDIQEVYMTICQELCEYRKYLENVTWKKSQL